MKNKKQFTKVIEYVLCEEQEKIEVENLTSSAQILEIFGLLKRENDLFIFSDYYKNIFDNIKAARKYTFSTTSFENFINQRDQNDNYMYNKTPKILFDLLINLKDKNYSKNPFEVFCLHLFKKIFPNSELENTPKKRDGGIDIKGSVYINEKAKQPFFAQCKLYNLSKAINVDEVRKFKGSIPNIDSINYIITTGYFTLDAIKEAAEKNINLIDGVELVSLMREYSYGVEVEYDTDISFLKKIVKEAK